MSGKIETHGDIEIICQSLAELAPNKLARLIFRTYADCAPPWQPHWTRSSWKSGTTAPCTPATPARPRVAAITGCG